MADIYLDHGFDSREDYLSGIADDYGVPLEDVTLLAELLGPSEDFDGLISSIEDMEYLTA